MPKIVGTRERIHQPFYDSLIRVDGRGDLRQANVGVFGAMQARSQLFTKQGADIAVSNLTTGGFFPSDQTFVTLAVRVWTYFRFNWESPRSTTGADAGFAQINAGGSTPVGEAGPGAGVTVTGDRVARVHKLYHQTQNQLFWQFQAGDKPQLTTYTAYTPMAGGLDGFFYGDTGALAAAAAGGTNFLAGIGDFIVLAGTPSISNTGPTVINGNIGISPAAAIIGFPPGIVNGTQSGPGPATVAAKNALTAAYLALQGMGPGTVIAAGLDGQTLTASGATSVFSTGAGLLSGGTLTFDALGDPDAAFIVITATTLITLAGSTIALAGGAQAHNIYFVVGSSATLGTTTTFNGNILALTSITLTTGANIVGRVLARNGAVVFDSNNVSVDANDPNVGPGADSGNQAGGYNRYRANNGVPTSSALMRLARPILIPPRQGFVVIAIASAIGQAAGASVVDQMNGLVPNNDAWGNGPNGTITGAPGSTGLSTAGRDDIEKDVKYLIDGIHSRDVL